MSRRKLSPKDFAALNRATIGVRYPPGGGSAELRMFSAKERRRRRKKPDELVGEPSRGCTRGDADAALTNQPTETGENKM